MFSSTSDMSDDTRKRYCPCYGWLGLVVAQLHDLLGRGSNLHLTGSNSRATPHRITVISHGIVLGGMEMELESLTSGTSM